MKKGSHYDNAKNVIAFFVVLLAFSIFLIFYTNQDAILSGNFYGFIILATVGAGLLLYLFYLVSNQPHLSKTKSVTKSSAKKKKKTK